jgi:Nuclease-related domain
MIYTVREMREVGKQKGMRAARDPANRTAGQHARAAVVRLRLRTLLTLGILAVATAALGRAFGLQDWRFLVAEVALLASMFAISRYVLPLVARRDRGASAEEHVGSLLAALPQPQWRIVHDASFGHGNVDHILIGPAGAFSIETKSHPGPVRVSRVHGATIRQAQAQRKAVEAATGLSVEPILAYSRAWVDRPGARRKGVRVLPARMLVGYLQKSRERLLPEEIAQAGEALRQALLEHARRERAARAHRIAAR